jgi:hypothetical protein
MTNGIIPPKRTSDLAIRMAIGCRGQPVVKTVD